MKNIKKFLLIMAMTMALGTSAFAASGFEFLFQLAGGFGVTIPNKEAKDLGIEVSGSADADVSAQIGYMFQVVDGFGISVLGELGYAFDMYSIGDGNTVGVYDVGLIYHSFKVGLLPKFNIGVGNGAIAIGIGGGVKIPISGTCRTTYRVDSDTLDSSPIYSLKRKDITEMFSPSVVGYMKVTFDYYLFFTDNIAMNFGLYLGGDFGPKMKYLDNIGCDSFDIGLQLGFRFGPKA